MPDVMWPKPLKMRSQCCRWKNTAIPPSASSTHDTTASSCCDFLPAPFKASTPWQPNTPQAQAVRVVNRIKGHCSSIMLTPLPSTRGCAGCSGTTDGSPHRADDARRNPCTGSIGVVAPFARQLAERLVVRTHERLNALVQVTEEARETAALGHALRQAALRGLLLAQRALLDHALLGVEVTHAVRAAHGTELAAAALRLVGSARCRRSGHVAGLGRAHLHALGVFAVLALHGQKVRVHVRGNAPNPRRSGTARRAASCSRSCRSARR